MAPALELWEQVRILRQQGRDERRAESHDTDIDVNRGDLVWVGLLQNQVAACCDKGRSQSGIHEIEVAHGPFAS